MESSQCPGVHTSVQHTPTFHPQEKLFLPPLEGRGIGKNAFLTCRPHKHRRTIFWHPVNPTYWKQIVACRASAVILYHNLMKFITVGLKCISDQIIGVQMECLMQMTSVWWKKKQKQMPFKPYQVNLWGFQPCLSGMSIPSSFTHIIEEQTPLSIWLTHDLSNSVLCRGLRGVCKNCG